MFFAIYFVILTVAAGVTIRTSRLKMRAIPLKATIACFAFILMATMIDGKDGVVASVVASLIFTTGVWVVGLATVSLDQAKLSHSAPIDFRRLLVRVGAAVAVMVAATVVLAAVVGNLGSVTLGLKMQQSPILGVVAIPIFEEVLFRAIPMGLVYNWKLSGALSSWIYFAGSSLFFSICHIYPLHPFRTPQTIIIGLTLALLYKKEGLLASTFAHIFFNATVFIYFLSK